MRPYEIQRYIPTLKGDARIWYYVEGGVVYLEQVHTSHPNQTKKWRGLWPTNPRWRIERAMP